MKRWKFIHILTMSLTLILALALLGAFLMQDRDLINVLIIPFVTALGAATTFFFKQNEKEADKRDGD